MKKKLFHKDLQSRHKNLPSRRKSLSQGKGEVCDEMKGTEQRADASAIVVPSQQVRWQVIALSLFLVATFTAFSCWAALSRNEILGAGYLPRGIVFLFLILVVFASLTQKSSLLPTLTRTDLLFIFALLNSIAAISGEEFAMHFYLNLIGLVYYSSPQSQWFNLFTPHIPHWLVPSLQFRDPAILWAYEGMPEGAKMPIGEWFIPLLAWTPYFFGVCALLVFLCWLMAKQWEEHERLVYPLTQVPAELTSGDGGDFSRFLRSLLFWLGFFTASIPYSLRGLHLFFPQFPDPQLQRDAGQLFPSGPLTAFNGLQLHFYPEMIGIAYLLSYESGLSLWFFQFMRRTEIAVRIALGYDMMHGEFVTYQTIGAYCVMAGYLLWVARSHISKLARKALSLFAKQRTQGDSEETLAFWGLIGTFIGLLLWVKWVAGASTLWAGLMLLGMLIVALVVARIVAETGIYIYSPPFRVNQVLFDIFGKDRIGAKNIVLLTAMSWMQIRSTATMASGYLTNTFRLGTLAGFRRGYMALWVLVALFLTLLVCHVSAPTVIYAYSVPKLSGWAQGAPLKATNLIAQYLTTSRPLTTHHWWGLVFGALTCWLLIKLRMTFSGFPIHPLGFVAWAGWPIDRYWLSVLLGWAVKVVVLRYGGFSLFQRMKPFAYGMIVGGPTTLTFWVLLRFFFPTQEVIIYD